MQYLLFVISSACFLQTIDGDAQLLAAVQNAQRANLARYPHGELRARIKSGQRGELSSAEVVEAFVRWADGRVRVDAEVREMRNQKAIADSDLEKLPVLHHHWLADKSTVTYYFAEVRRVQVHPKATIDPRASAYFYEGWVKCRGLRPAG
jgi:hypothetical protein